MGSYKPYIKDALTGLLKYVTEKPTSSSNLDKEMEHFKRNYSRLVGQKPHQTHFPANSPRESAQKEALAYYNLYYYGHRIP